MQYKDIRTTDFTVWRDRIDVLTGGFPCQPFSLAGKRRGTEDDRYLWPAMLEAIRTVRPCWVVGENVYGIVNWSDGMVFDTVCSDLEAEGYEVQPYVIPACGVDAPHRRNRVWFVAHFTENAERLRCENDRPEEEPSPGEFGEPRAGNTGRLRTATAGASVPPNIPNWQRFPTEPPVCGRDDGFPGGLDGIAFPDWCRESIKSYGNTIAPQVALQLFETINEYERLCE